VKNKVTRSTRDVLAHTADLVLLNGLIVTGAQGADTPPRAQAIAMRSGRVLAVGEDDDVRDAIGAATLVIDVGGRTIIPGLIDSHLHMIRAGLTWNQELHWEPVTQLRVALGMIMEAARRQKPGSWIRVVGGWHHGQFAERRPPTRAELDQAAPDHPVYVQFIYEWALLNSAAIRALNLTRETEDPPGGHFERDAQGEPTGLIRGLGAYAWVTERMTPATLEEQVASTRSLSLAFNRVGLTGVIDGGGYGTGPDSYGAIYELWRRGGLTTRVRLTLHASASGVELEEFQQLVRFANARFGDGRLQVLGGGEITVYAAHDREGLYPFELTPDALADLRRVTFLLAKHRWSLHQHAALNETITAVLDIWEEVNRAHPIAPLRWAVLHAEPIDERNIRRIKALGAGLLIQSRHRFRGNEMLQILGAERMRSVPPLRTMLDANIPVGAGTDAMRAAWFNPFPSLHWFVTGRSITGAEVRGPEHLLSREEALRLYTLGSAWFSYEEETRGSLEPGKLADLAVLSADYLTVPEEELPHIESLLTVVGGQPVYAVGPFAGLEDRADALLV